MKRAIFLIAVGSAAAGFGFTAVMWADGADEPRRVGTGIPLAALSQGAGSGRGHELKGGTERAVGVFEVGKGRKVKLRTADTIDGMSCLLEEDEKAGAGATCLDGGLFEARRVAFAVNSLGGPDRFDELYVSGVAAPGIRSVWLVKTDGSSIQVALNSERAFVVESPASELERAIYPTGFRLYGPNGKLVETVSFPPPG